MIEFKSTKDLAAFILWTRHHALFPLPKIVAADFESEELGEHHVTVNYGDQFTIGFYGIKDIQDTFTKANQEVAVANRITRMIFDFLRDSSTWTITGQQGDFVDCPSYLLEELQLNFDSMNIR